MPKINVDPFPIPDNLFPALADRHREARDNPLSNCLFYLLTGFGVSAENGGEAQVVLGA
jgi:hypothetical protein